MQMDGINTLFAEYTQLILLSAYLGKHTGEGRHVQNAYADGKPMDPIHAGDNQLTTAYSRSVTPTLIDADLI